MSENILNKAVELHDSELKSVRWEGDSVILELTVYVHSSAGSPGLDAGEGWEQDAEIKIGSAKVAHLPAGDRLWILDGSVQDGNTAFNNVLPLPFDRRGAVSVRLVGAESSFSATGNGMLLTLKGPPRNVEPFPGP
jgi:hypothetical protein